MNSIQGSLSVNFHASEKSSGGGDVGVNKKFKEVWEARGPHAASRSDAPVPAKSREPDAPAPISSGRRKVNRRASRVPHQPRKQWMTREDFNLRFPFQNQASTFCVGESSGTEVPDDLEPEATHTNLCRVLVPFIQGTPSPPPPLALISTPSSPLSSEQGDFFSTVGSPQAVLSKEVTVPGLFDDDECEDCNPLSVGLPDAECVSEWVLSNMETFSKTMGFSLDGCELQAMALFTTLERKRIEDSKLKAKKPVTPKTADTSRELKRLEFGVNYDTRPSDRRSTARSSGKKVFND